MFEDRRCQRGATREDKIRAVHRLDAANGLDDVWSKGPGRAPFKTLRTVGCDEFCCRIEAVRHRTARRLWPEARPNIVGATAKQQTEALAIRGEDYISASGGPIGDRLNAATKYVATHRPESLEWGPFEGLGPDIVEGIRSIKSQDGPDLVLSGSSTLTSTVLERGLADEVLLVVYPVLLGTGKRFFAEGTPPRSFELVSTQAFPSGIIFSAYKVAGALKAG